MLESLFDKPMAALACMGLVVLVKALRSCWNTARPSAADATIVDLKDVTLSISGEDPREMRSAGADYRDRS